VRQSRRHRRRARDILADTWREPGWDDDDEPAPDRLLDQVWPAAVAYVISLHTQAARRPGHRAPLEQLSGSFDSLPDHLTLIDSPLDIDDIESTIDVGIQVITEAL
jgi:hypothetical protein